MHPAPLQEAIRVTCGRCVCVGDLKVAQSARTDKLHRIDTSPAENGSTAHSY